MISNNSAENNTRVSPNNLNELVIKAKCYDLTPIELITFKREIKEKVNYELNLIFGSVGNFDEALEAMKNSQILTDLYELYNSQLELADREQDYEKYDMYFNPDFNSVPAILNNLKRAVFVEIDNVQLNHVAAPFIYRLKAQRLIFHSKQYEKNFPTIIDILRQLRFELSQNDFELYKTAMIDHIAERLGLKIGLANFAVGFTAPQLNQFKLIEQEIKKEFRVFVSRVNFAELQSTGKDYLEELIKVFESSFSVRDVATIYRAGEQAVKLNLYPENTQALIQFYRKDQMPSSIIDSLFVEVAKIISQIPYRDSIHTLKPV
jgi:hypothetical protein